MRRSWVVGCAALLAAMAAVTADVLARGPLTSLDFTIHEQLSLHVRDTVWWVAYAMAQLGNEYVLIPLLGVLCLLAAARRWSLRPIVATFVVCATLGVVVPAIKILTGRTAPRSGFDAVFAGGAEYPSGHAVNAIVLWGAALEMLVLAFPVVRRWLTVRVRRVLVVVWGLASAVGMLGLDYHWFTDALGGWLLGAAIYVAFIAVGVPAMWRRRSPVDSPAAPETSAAPVRPNP